MVMRREIVAAPQMTGRPMQLLLIRHAIAEDRFEFARTGKSDYYRPLTERGRVRMGRGAAGLRTVVPAIDVLASSPLTRAVQTAEILAAAYGGLPIEHADSLATGDPRAFLDWLGECGSDVLVAAVGHEPHMSDWAAWLLTGGRHDFALFKKGSAMLLEFPDSPKPGAALLHWFLAPAQLRRLGS
jgi:phosphohistidine phosphatase